MSFHKVQSVYPVYLSSITIKVLTSCYSLLTKRLIQWTEDSDTGATEYMGVDHGRGDMSMPQQFLYCSDIMVRLKQVGCKTMA